MRDGRYQNYTQGTAERHTSTTHIRGLSVGENSLNATPHRDVLMKELHKDLVGLTLGSIALFVKVGSE